MTLDTVIRERPADVGSASADDVTDLVEAARRNDSAAWNRLISRYTPLVTGVARGYRLSAADVDDITQTVWLRCFQNLHTLRDPRALPGWLKTTTQHEALRFLNSGNRTDALCRELTDQLVDTGATVHPEPASELLRHELVETVQRGLDELAPKERRLLQLLHATSRPSYTEISLDLGMPRGSIGPTRARCLAKLRHTDTVARYLHADQLALGA